MNDQDARERTDVYVSEYLKQRTRSLEEARKAYEARQSKTAERSKTEPTREK